MNGFNSHWWLLLRCIVTLGAAILKMSYDFFFKALCFISQNSLKLKKKRGEEFSTYVIWLGKNWNADKFWFLLSMILTTL